MQKLVSFNCPLTNIHVSAPWWRVVPRRCTTSCQMFVSSPVQCIHIKRLFRQQRPALSLTYVWFTMSSMCPHKKKTRGTKSDKLGGHGVKPLVRLSWDFVFDKSASILSSRHPRYCRMNDPITKSDARNRGRGCWDLLKDKSSLLPLFYRNCELICLPFLSTFEPADEFSWNLTHIYATRGHSASLHSNFLPPVILTWRPCKVVRWEEHDKFFYLGFLMLCRFGSLRSTQLSLRHLFVCFSFRI
jgi:hypothetical protein